MSINNTRANTKATPEAVFEACAMLAITKPDYRNEDVLAITGGGMTVVSRLVRIYKDNQAVIEACDELDPSTTINLVQATNALLSNHKAKTRTALDAAKETYLTTIQTLTEENESLTKELELARSALNNEVETANDLRADYDKTLQVLAARKQELETAKASEQKAITVQNALQEKYDSKIEELNNKHTDKLAAALEAQRKTFESEKERALIAAQATYENRLAGQSKEIASLNEELAASKSQEIELQVQNKILLSEQNNLRQQLVNLDTEMCEALEEKREQLRETQEVYRQLISTFKTQQESQAEYIADNFSTVSKSANTLRPLLDELTKKLDQLLIKAGTTIERPNQEPAP